MHAWQVRQEAGLGQAPVWEVVGALNYVHGQTGNFSKPRLLVCKWPHTGHCEMASDMLSGHKQGGKGQPDIHHHHQPLHVRILRLGKLRRSPRSF